MAMMRTANPALNDNTFRQARAFGAGERMTINGTVNKTALLLIIALVPAAWVWQRLYAMGADANINLWLIGGAIGGLVAALVTVFKKEWAPFTAPLYAAFEGLVIGALSAVVEMRFPGIVIQAVALTFGTLGCLLIAYKSGVIKATENFKLGVFAATGAIALIYLATMVLGIFGIHIPYIHGNGVVGIIFSVVVVVIAALNLVLDFDFIEQGAAMGAPKYMEWYAAFGLLVTLVWLYIEILRLLSKMRSRD